MNGILRAIFGSTTMLIVALAVLAIVVILAIVTKARASNPGRDAQHMARMQAAFRQQQQPFPAYPHHGQPNMPPPAHNPYAGYGHATAHQLGGAHAQPRPASWGPGNSYGANADGISC